MQEFKIALTAAIVRKPTHRHRVVILSHILGLLAFFDTQGAAAQTHAPLPPIIDISAEGHPRLTAGLAVVERIGKVYLDAQGPHAAARAGDWRLANDKVSLYFATIAPDSLTSDSMPLAGYSDVLVPANRIPGALIDVTLPGRELDFVAFFTQGVGTKPYGDKVLYDTIEPVERDGAVGLRMEGSPFDNALLRLRTTYWIREGEFRVAIESRLLDTEPDSPLPELADIGQWYSGAYLFEGGEIPMPGQNSSVKSKYYAINGDIYSVALAATTGTLTGVFSGNEAIIRTRLDAETTATAAQLAPLPPGDGILLTRRDLWFGPGVFDSVTGPILAARGEKLGTLQGSIAAGEGLVSGIRRFVTIFKVGVTSVDESTGIPVGDGTIPSLFTVTEVDEQGSYSVQLPDGFYNPTPEYNFDPRFAYAGIYRVVPDAVTRRDFQLLDAGGVRVQVVDDATSEPVEARVRIEPISPAPAVNFGFDFHRLASLDSIYVPREGILLPLAQGNYLFHATRGPRYTRTEVMIKAAAREIGEQVIRLKEAIPTTGWIGIEMGARTTATPGCAIPPEAYVRMAAAEGLDWIISGDYEVITDFEPIIERLGLTGKLRASRGFRTLLPAHPEWGHLFVFPVTADAPDPAKARAQWANAQTSTQWLTAVRKAYPGAIIQIDVPWNRGGRGYFSRGETNVFVAANDPAPDADPAIDALNILPPRSPWEFDAVMAGWYNHMINGRHYVGSTAPLARHLYGGEPGYPRLMAKVSAPLASLQESDLFNAIKQKRTQLTNGPFIQWGGQGLNPGDLVAMQSNPEFRVRVTSTNWNVPSRISMDKDGVPQLSEILHLEAEEYQRFPPPESGVDYKTHTLRTLRVRDFKDTLMGVSALGFASPLDAGLRSYSPMINNNSFAVIHPIIIDANGNNAYDPLATYGQRGQ